MDDAAVKNRLILIDGSSLAYRAYFALPEGIATREQVDALMMDCFRWPRGPFGMATSSPCAMTVSQSGSSSRSMPFRPMPLVGRSWATKRDCRTNS